MSAAVLTTHPAHLDDEIMALALQLEEIEYHSDNQKGKHKADNPPDVNVAFTAFQKELQQAINLLKDVQFAHSVAQAVDMDGHIITRIAQEEAQGERDRRLALQLGGQNPDLVLEAPPPYSEEGRDNALVDEGNGLPFTYAEFQTAITKTSFLLDVEEEEKGGPSMTYAERQRTALEKLPHHNQQCVACTDKFSSNEIVRAPCGTLYCKECLKHLFMTSTKDQGLYPPVCCRQEIPLSFIESAMTAEELDRFQEAGIEFATVDRTYCNSLQCGRFIPPTQITADRATCVHCGRQTCTHCKNELHTGDCPEDHALQATLQLAEESGWQRCYKCRAMLELGIGCYHMTCHCGAQFCYLCGEIWKRCRCERWDEGRLEDRAEQVVDREAVHPLRPQERQQRVREMREELVENHECNHPWRFEKMQGAGRRGFRCEMCDDRHWKYILQCRRCHVQVCENCRRNRIR